MLMHLIKNENVQITKKRYKKNLILNKFDKSKKDYRLKEVILCQK